LKGKKEEIIERGEAPLKLPFSSPSKERGKRL